MVYKIKRLNLPGYFLTTTKSFDMNLVLRSGTAADANVCGTICYDAFKNIADQHNFPADFPHADAAIGLMNFLFSNPQIYSVIAEADGQVVGSNFLWEDQPISAIGPITVNPAVQNDAIGRKLMEHLLKRATEKKFAGVRLVQSAYHSRSLSLYTKLGFDAREPLSAIQGKPLNIQIPGYPVRPATAADTRACDKLCYAVHGLTRSAELTAAIKSGTAAVVEHQGEISGYTTGIGFFGHSVATGNDSLQALIGAAATFNGPGFLLPTRNATVLRWCLYNGLRIIQPMTLMSMGLYNEPSGSFLASVLY